MPARTGMTRSVRARRWGSIGAAAVLIGAVAAGVGTGLASAVDCETHNLTAPVVADTWLDENSPATSKGTDSVLNVDSGSLNVDTGVASGRARALVRFAMPATVPEGCVIASARLILFSTEESAGSRA